MSIMQSIAIVWIAGAIALGCVPRDLGTVQRGGERSQAVAQYCMPMDDYPDLDRLYC
jgi:hypothetical protein